MNRLASCAGFTLLVLASTLAGAACVGSDAVGAGQDAATAPTTTTTTPPPDSGGPAPDSSTPPTDASTTPDAADGATTAPAAPPVVSPAAWLDARNIATGTTSLRTWRDSTANGADAVGATALSVDRTVLGGKPGVVFVGEASQVIAIPAAKLAAFRTFAGAGFSVFMVASFKDGTQARTAQAVLFERYALEPVAFGPKRAGATLVLDSALTSVSGTLSSYPAAAPQISATVAGAAPSKNAPHLYVLTSLAGSVSLRIDGKEIQKTSGFVENNFSENGTVPFSIGAYSNTNAAQFGLIGAIGMVAIYTRPISDVDIAAGEVAAKAAWGIP